MSTSPQPSYTGFILAMGVQRTTTTPPSIPCSATQQRSLSPLLQSSASGLPIPGRSSQSLESSPNCLYMLPKLSCFFGATRKPIAHNSRITRDPNYASHRIHLVSMRICMSPFGTYCMSRHRSRSSTVLANTSKEPDIKCIGVSSPTATRKTSLNSANWAGHVIVTTSSQTCCMLSPGTACLEKLYSASRPGLISSCRLSSTSSLWSKGRHMLLPLPKLRKAGSMTLSIQFISNCSHVLRLLDL
jgi:hypothetical protein